MMDGLIRQTEARCWQLREKYNYPPHNKLPSDLRLAEVAQSIARSSGLMRGINTLQELDDFVLFFEKRLPFEQGAFRDSRVTDINLTLFNLADFYGLAVKEEQLKEGEFAYFADYAPIDSSEIIEELRVLPDHPRKLEVIDKAISLSKRRERISKKHNQSKESLYNFICPGFYDWRTAVLFARYAHNGSSKITHKKFSTVLTMHLNYSRYKRFGLTSLENVKEFEPGALFHVENVFGKFATEYVCGNAERFRELLMASQKRGAKSLFNEGCFGDYDLFRQNL